MNLEALAEAVKINVTQPLPTNTQHRQEMLDLRMVERRAARAVVDAPRMWRCRPAAQLWPHQSCPGEKMEHHLWCGWVHVIEEEI